MRSWKHLCLTTAFLALVQSACDDADRKFVAPAPKITEPIEWIEATKSLEDYEKDYPDRAIFAFFTADFDLVGTYLEEQLNLQRLSIFPSDDFVFIRYDTAILDGVATRELGRLKHYRIPLFVTNRTGQWIHVEGMLTEIRAMTR